MNKKNDNATESVIRNSSGYDVSKFLKIKTTVRRVSSTGKLTASSGAKSSTSEKAIAAAAKAT